MGQGSTSVAAGRNSIGNELEPVYFEMARERVRKASFSPRTVGALMAAVVEVDAILPKQARSA